MRILIHTTRAPWDFGALNEVCPESVPPILLVLHALERSSCLLGDDSSSGRPVQGRMSAASRQFSVPSMAIGSSPAEKWPRRSKSKPSAP